MVAIRKIWASTAVSITVGHGATGHPSRVIVGVGGGSERASDLLLETRPGQHHRGGSSS